MMRRSCGIEEFQTASEQQAVDAFELPTSSFEYGSIGVDPWFLLRILALGF